MPKSPENGYFLCRTLYMYPSKVLTGISFLKNPYNAFEVVKAVIL